MNDVAATGIIPVEDIEPTAHPIERITLLAIAGMRRIRDNYAVAIEQEDGTIMIKSGDHPNVIGHILYSDYENPERFREPVVAQVRKMQAGDRIVVAISLDNTASITVFR